MTLYYESLGLLLEEDGSGTRSPAGILAGIAAVIAACGDPRGAARLWEPSPQSMRRSGHSQPSGAARPAARRIRDEPDLDVPTAHEERERGAALSLPEAIATARNHLVRFQGEIEAGVPSHDQAIGSGLTPRELDVLRLVAMGHSNREIADALFISVPTVKRHVANILGKLHVSSRSAATAYAYGHKLV